MRSEFVQTASLKVHLLHAGRQGAEPVILLHGFPQTSHMWRHQIPALAERYDVYAPDTRGFGDTEKPRVRLSRDILARDVIELIDALGFERAALVGHDWGGIIASAAALHFPERVTSLALIDTLVSVWIPWGIHGYWFKCEPEAERFWEKHHRDFIRSVFGGEAPAYGGPPESPWAGMPDDTTQSRAVRQVDPGRHWTPEDVAHYEEKFAHPDVWFHAIEYYRHCLPFHIERTDPQASGGRRFEFLSNPRVAEMWNHPGGIFQHPDFQHYMVFAPEDRHRQYPGRAFYLFSPFLVPQAFENGLPPDDYIPAGNLYAESFGHHFPDLRTRGAQCGHFIPEEDPQRTTELLLAFLAGEI
ncbi:MAG: alpha/beta hydrolase [Proteobacteria bacterium]|nr:alpha/beta hydrolase [Pseudomonadota bacterium]